MLLPYRRVKVRRQLQNPDSVLVDWRYVGHRLQHEWLRLTWAARPLAGPLVQEGQVEQPSAHLLALLEAVD